MASLCVVASCEGSLNLEHISEKMFYLKASEPERSNQEDSYKKYAKKISYPDNILEMLNTIQDKCQVYLELLGTCSVVGIHNTVR